MAKDIDTRCRHTRSPRLIVKMFNIPDPDEGEFEFQVNDGVNYAKKQTFHIKARPLVLELANNRPLEVYPGILQPVITEHLLAKTNDDNQTQPIVHTIITQPRNGRLVWVTSNGTQIEANSFTQRDVDVGSIAYHFTSTLSKWVEQDSFEFEVSVAHQLPNFLKKRNMGCCRRDTRNSIAC